MAASTVKSTYLTGSQVFAQVVTDGLIGRTPCREIKLPRSRTSEDQHFLSPDQVRALVNAISDRYRALIYLAA
jgi:hypothetical protein